MVNCWVLGMMGWKHPISPEGLMVDHMAQWGTWGPEVTTTVTSGCFWRPWQSSAIRPCSSREKCGFPKATRSLADAHGTVQGRFIAAWEVCPGSVACYSISDGGTWPISTISCSFCNKDTDTQYCASLPQKILVHEWFEILKHDLVVSPHTQQDKTQQHRRSYPHPHCESAVINRSDATQRYCPIVQ